MVENPAEYPWSSYLATAGTAKPHPSLTTDWVLGQFSRKRGKAEQEYRKFVHWGIGQKTIWTEVRGQALLGEEGFVDKLVDHLKKQKDIPEIPRSQRYAHRPSLEKLFSQEVRMNLRKRRGVMIKAVDQYGYRQSEIAAYLGLHYSSVSRIVKGER
jgi:predicted XRE-type DNA-binding protein